MSSPILQTQGLQKIFEQGGQSLTILHNVDIAIEPGEIVALVGPSGSGKSTLLQILGLLDQPTAGDVFLETKSVVSLKDRQRTLLRQKLLGFVYQFHYLLPEFSAIENVVLPQMIAGINQKDAESHAQKLLESLKLNHRIKHRPARLSGGEQQRVAIARALANNPKLLLADEPTGNLDPETSDIVFDMLTELVREQGVAALIATHNLQLAERMDRILELKAGRIMSY